MKQSRKWFLVVWIPVMFFVTVGIFDTLGKPILITKPSLEGGIEQAGVRLRTVNDILFPFILLIVFSFIMFIIAGLDGYDKNNKDNMCK